MSGEFIALLTMLRFSAAALLVAIGVLAMLGNAIGGWRLPDFYTRLHASGAGNAVGGAIVLLGLSCAAPELGIALRLLLLAALLVIAAPSLHYMAANAAHVAGLAPLAGKSARSRQGAPP